jgi:hypothetical protein
MRVFAVSDILVVIKSLNGIWKCCFLMFNLTIGDVASVILNS